MPSQILCARFSYASNDSQFNLPHTHNRDLGVFAVAIMTTTKTDKNCHFCMVMPPQAICVDLSYASNKNNLQIYLPHTRNCGLRVFDVAIILPPKLTKIAISVWLCPLKRFMYISLEPQTKTIPNFLGHTLIIAI